MNQHPARNYQQHVDAPRVRTKQLRTLISANYRRISAMFLHRRDTSNLVFNRHFRRPQAAVFIFTSLSASFASAIVGDPVRPFAEISYAHETNLLRAAPTQLHGDSGADSYRRVDAGVVLDKSFGRQHVSGNFKLSRTLFEKFTGLDNQAKDLQATWNWQVGNDVEGNLGAQYTQGLAPFSEFRSNVRNLRTQKNSFVDAKWRVYSNWSLHAGVTHQSLAYDFFRQQIGNRNEDAQEIGLDYLPASGSSIGVVFRRTRDSYPVQQQLGTLVVANSYRQNDYKLKADWIVSGKSRLQFLGGVVQRDYDVFQSRNKTAPSVRITDIWQPTNKIKLVLAAYHEISPSDDLTVNYSVNNGVSLATSWDVLAKVRLDALLRRENRDFNAASAFSAASPSNRLEKSRFGSVQLTWSPRQDVQLTTSLFRDDLDATFAQRAYRAAGAVVGLRAVY